MPYLQTVINATAAGANYPTDPQVDLKDKFVPAGFIAVVTAAGVPGGVVELSFDGINDHVRLTGAQPLGNGTVVLPSAGAQKVWAKKVSGADPVEVRLISFTSV